VGPLIGVLAAIGYVAILAGVWEVFGLDSETISDTSGSIVKGIIIPIGSAPRLRDHAGVGLGLPTLQEHRSGGAQTVDH
jgi:hypothetical protein